MSSSLDILTTALCAAEINCDKYKDLDGENLLPYLDGRKKGDPHETLYWRKLDEAAIRHQEYKLIRVKDYGTNLYNLNKDIKEQNNLSNTSPNRLNELSQKLKTWEKGITPPLWKEEKKMDESDKTYSREINGEQESIVQQSRTNEKNK